MDRSKALRLIRRRRLLRAARARLAAFLAPLKRRRRPIGFSALSALLLLVITYFVDSAPYPIGGEINVSQWIEFFRAATHRGGNHVPDSISLVNVAYDKTLVDYEAPLYGPDNRDETFPAGQLAITDRSKLLRFLSVADSLGTYRYILLDVRFEDEVESDSVSRRLFDLISGMDNLIFARHETGRLDPEAPREKTALGDYYTTLTVAGMVKYPVLKFDSISDSYEPSLGAQMYADLQGHRLSKSGLLTFDDGRLCRRSIYPTFPVRLASWASDSEEFGPVLQYLNLGVDILDMADPEATIEEMIRDRIVIVGDFDDDVHLTFIGNQPGALVNLNSYIALCRGDHLVNWWGSLALFAVYFLISLTIFSRFNLSRRITWLRSPRLGFIRFIISFIGYSLILTLIAAAIYLAFGLIFSIAFPSLYFSILQSCTKRDY